LTKPNLVSTRQKHSLNVQWLLLLRESVVSNEMSLSACLLSLSHPSPLLNTGGSLTIDALVS